MGVEKQDSAYLEITKAVLGELELQFGLDCIRPLNSEVRATFGNSTASLGLSFHLLAAHSLRSSTKELLVLLDRPLEEQDERLSLVTKVARDLVDCRVATCVADGIQQTTDSMIEGLSLRLLNPRKLFASILRLPPSFKAQLETLAGIQRPDEFSYAFQERTAHVHVVAGRRPAKQVVDLHEYFKAWLGTRGRHSPILLLGERGSGKSWQMLRFALDAHRLHDEHPWRYGPAFLVRLRDLVDLVEHATSVSPVICEYLFQNHPGLSAVFGGATTLGAMFGAGYAVVLVDGFDEMDVLPTDARVRNRLTSLLLLLSKRTRFVLSSRSGHFSSLSSLFAMPAWSGSTIGQLFEVLTITPFEERQKVAYINAARSHEAASLQRIFAFGNGAASPLQRALSICASHPGLLAQIKDEVISGVDNPLKLIGDAIFAILIDFNLLHGRTQEDYRIVSNKLAAAYGLPQEEWIELSQLRRAELLGDIAWHMAERGVDTVDLANLPPRIRLEYGIADEALERDLRSQTVFELATPDSQPASYSDLDTSDEDSKRRSLRRTKKRQVARSSIVRFSIRDPLADSEHVGESSVTGAYFLARYLEARLLEPGPFGDLPAAVRFRCLGRIPLGAMGAAMLSEMLRSAGFSGRRFGEDAWRLLVELAKNGSYQVFSPSYRYLVSNLQLLGALSQDRAKLLNPWQSTVSSIVRGPLRHEMKDYRMALIPPSPMAKTKQESEPFLLGVHEITNEHFYRFVTSKALVNEEDCTVQGSEWSVERVTKAGSGDARSRSKNHRLTNEYHLFTWLPTERLGGANGSRTMAYLPPEAIRDHPVTYVSWFAAAAFCDWLSIGEGIDRVYEGELLNALGLHGETGLGEPKTAAEAYRLPSMSEWIWAAKGGHKDLRRPWEAFPYYLRERSARDGKQRPLGVVDDEAWTRYSRYQQVMRAVLLGTGKQAREVFYDQPNDYGVSGLMGNVREWCQDIAKSKERETERMILGATGFLGEGTFDFKYSTSLYLRNTNPDVGFRIARSLQSNDIKQLRQREKEIASLESSL